MSILDDLVVDRVPGAPYGFEDMNRVGEAMQYVAARLRACGWGTVVTPKTDFTRWDFPSVSVFDHYLQQLRLLRDALLLPITTPPTPVVGSTKDYMTYDEANDIEQILLDIELTVVRTRTAYYQMGDLYMGEV